MQIARIAALALLVAVPAAAQVPTAPVYRDPSGQIQPSIGNFLLDATGKAIGPSTPLSAVGPTMAATTWPDGTQPQDMRAYASVEIQVSGLSGGDTITVSRSLTSGGAYANQAYVDGTFSVGTTISADGTYSYTGFGLMKWTKTGTASSPAVVIRGSN